jgi:hypothetical protein
MAAVTLSSSRSIGMVWLGVDCTKMRAELGHLMEIPQLSLQAFSTAPVSLRTAHYPARWKPKRDP